MGRWMGEQERWEGNDWDGNIRGWKEERKWLADFGCVHSRYRSVLRKNWPFQKKGRED